MRGGRHEYTDDEPHLASVAYDVAEGIVEPGEYRVIGGRHSLDDQALRARFVVG
jgi:hypothetical protein